MVPRGLCKLRIVIHNKTVLTSTGRSFQSTFDIGGMACEWGDGARAGGNAAGSSLCFAPQKGSAEVTQLPLPESAARGVSSGGARGVCGVTGLGCCGESDLWQQRGATRAGHSGDGLHPRQTGSFSFSTPRLLPLLPDG